MPQISCISQEEGNDNNSTIWRSALIKQAIYLTNIGGAPTRCQALFYTLGKVNQGDKVLDITEISWECGGRK